MTTAEVHGHAAHDDHHDEHHIDPMEALDNAKFATWLYLGSEVMIFTAMIIAFLVFRTNNPEINLAAQDGMNIFLVSANTFILLASSWMMVMGLREIQMNNPQGMMMWLSGTVILGAIFVGGQIYEYVELAHHGIILSGTTDFAAYGARFYAPTAFHGAHVVVGVGWGIWLLNKAYRGHFSGRNFIAVEVFGLYWHFVDVVWIVLFTFIYLI